ncbi:hypothetical protein JMJ77_0005749 [Colletotrichum scovillei]|uniref:Uncharacterized protein n=1 Tax=Colletotrichum scovillei TaxID=1209932 RepID=A0A9P7RHV0_9PEZI|nr:hypothetical protein JMJ77_0005749 [Colletotrichum scovillei]KAG7076952.1 hypothetical protein JMJ76_0014208 [Colletotrichum scovillei]KAG7084121.1 hypothetical protein JMJ78_0009561 [Colletotrichum scovillei]
MFLIWIHGILAGRTRQPRRLIVISVLCHVE